MFERRNMARGQKRGRRSGMRADFTFLSGAKVFPGRAGRRVFGLGTGQTECSHLANLPNGFGISAGPIPTIIIQYIYGGISAPDMMKRENPRIHLADLPNLYQQYIYQHIRGYHIPDIW